MSKLLTIQNYKSNLIIKVMGRIKIKYSSTGLTNKPVRCFLGNDKVSLTTIGVDEADAFKKMCKQVKRLYNAVPKMRKFLYEFSNNK